MTLSNMPSLPAPLTSLPALEQAFAEGLAGMLEQHRGLGVYILALANAAYDASLWARLATPLAARHALLAERIANTLREGGSLDEPDDDALVFLKLLAIGFARLQTMQSRRAGLWELSFNPIRALRPPRMSGASAAPGSGKTPAPPPGGGKPFLGRPGERLEKIDQLLRPFDPAGFHFNKPFLAREVLWEGELAGKAARLLYNKFPFARLHGLLVPEPARELPQYLTPELHGWAWDVCAQAGAAVPGFNLAYNSYGALASVNHLHFQSFVRERPLPVQDPAFAHNGGEHAYPLPCRRFTDAETAWFHLDELHSQGTPYNLIYAADSLHVLARAPQGSRAQAAWSAGFGWSDLAGVFTLFRRDEYEHLSEAEIAAELAHLTP